MAEEFVVGLDLGTTNVKALLFTTTGNVVFEKEEEITTRYPEPGGAEQNPLEIEAAAIRCLRSIIYESKKWGGEILAVGFSCAMHSLLFVNENLEPLSNMLIWSDGRSQKNAEELLKNNGKDIYRRTGTPIHPMNPLVKLCWLQEREFFPLKEAAYIMTMKDFLIARWFGVRMIDYAMASSTGLFNIHTYDWDEKALAVAGIRNQQLSTPVSPDFVLPKMKADIATAIGVEREIPFVIGAADGQLANLGSGAIDEEELAITVGTSGAIRQFIPGVAIDEEMRTFCYAFTRTTAIVGGPTNNGGIVLQWLKEILGIEEDFSQFLQLAEHAPAGSEGVLFLPYINGERAPLWKQDAKGTFFGLSITHRKEHLIRAALEGISFNLYQIAQSLTAPRSGRMPLYVSGGLARSRVWLQILADIFGRRIVLPTTPQSSAWGASWCALVGIGQASDFRAIKEHVGIRDVIEPDSARHEIYLERYALFEKLSRNLERY